LPNLCLNTFTILKQNTDNSKLTKPFVNLLSADKL